MGNKVENAEVTIRALPFDHDLDEVVGGGTSIEYCFGDGTHGNVLFDAQNTPVSIFPNREARDVLKSLVDQTVWGARVAAVPVAIEEK